MNLKHLYFFRKLADLEHFGLAAKELGISQPSLSYAMSSLQKEVGVPLFRKNGRNVTLTPQGRAFSIFAEQALEILGNGLDYIRSLKDVEDKNAVILLCDDRIGESARSAAIKYLESKFDSKTVLALSVSEKDAKAFVEQGLANFELTIKQKDPILEGKDGKLPFKFFENKRPAIRLSSNAHIRNQSLLS